MEERKTSLIKDFTIEDLGQDTFPRYKVDFIVVNDNILSYYTNSKIILDALKSRKGRRFIIEYEMSQIFQESDASKIVKLKLKKTSK